MRINLGDTRKIMRRGATEIRGLFLVSSSWQPLLADAKVQALLNHLIGERAGELRPVLDWELGACYPEAEKISGLEPLAAKHWLETLCRKGVLTKKFFETVVECPQCKSSNAPITYRCPHCRSNNIEKKALLEHSVCGAIENDDRFRHGDVLVCPRCGEQLGEHGQTYWRVGMWFVCRECSKTFDRAETLHVCRKCKNGFRIDDALLQDVSSYSVAKSAEETFKDGLTLLKPLRQFFERLGYVVEMPSNLRGASGKDYLFDLAARRPEGNSDLLVMDVYASSDAVRESSVVTMFAKQCDINPTHSVIVAIPGMVTEGKTLASLYQITVVEARNAAEAVEKLEMFMAAPGKSNAAP